MRFESRHHGDLLRRFLVGALLAAGPIVFGAPAMAQTIRFNPNPANFTAATSSVDIFVDNVPAAGLKGFHITFSYNDNLLAFVGGTLDPDVVTSWGGPGGVLSDAATATATQVDWVARIGGAQAGLSGTVRLGSISFHGVGGAFGSADFTWSLAGIATSGAFNDSTVPNQLDGHYNVGAPDTDLTVSCLQISPPNPNFVDGDAITLHCQTQNSGTGFTSAGTSSVGYISADTVVDSSDTLIGETTIPVIGPQTSFDFDITGSPTFGSPGPRNFCVKVDASPQNLAGSIFETDETNNTFCIPVQILFPVRDLVVLDFPSVTPSPLDPNNLHAGSDLQATFTVKNVGNAILREHVDAVRISPDSVIDPNDTPLCSIDVMYPIGSVPGGLLGGASETFSLGLDPNAPTLHCTIPFAQPPGNYFIGVVADANNQVSETDPNGLSLEGNNTNSVAVTVLAPLPATLVPADPNVLNDLRQEMAAPGKAKASFSVTTVNDLASYGFTVTWAPAADIEIADPNDAVAASAFLQVNGRTASCAPLVINNAAGTVTVSCTSSGAGAGAVSSTGTGLLTVQFTTLAPGTGTFTFSNPTGTDSAGNPVAFNLSGGTFTVTGPADDQYSNLVAPTEVFPGAEFTTSFDICNQGFDVSPTGIRTFVLVSVDPNITAADSTVCSVLETAPLAARACENRSVSTCSFIGDPRPGNYTLGLTHDTDPNTLTAQVTSSLPLPPRIFALRAKGTTRSLEATRAPSGPGGSVGAILASDSKFGARSIAGVRTVLRNFNLLAGFIKPTKGQKVNLYRTPKLLASDVDSLATSSLRLPPGTVQVLGGADVNGDGEDELILLKKTKAGEILDFRLVNYAKRRPEVGVSIAVTAPFTGKVVGAAGIQIDGDPEDEVAVVIDDGTTQTLTINDLTITAPPIASGLVALASDPNFGGGASDNVLGICVIDYGLDGTPLAPSDQIVALTESPSGAQSLKVFDPPAGLPNQATLVADDPQFGGVNGKLKVVSIACTR